MLEQKQGSDLESALNSAQSYSQNFSFRPIIIMIEDLQIYFFQKY